MHLLFWAFNAPPSAVHFWAFEPLQVQVCSGALSTKLPLGTSMHLPFQLLISAWPPPAGGGVVGPPDPNGVRIRPAARGSPSCTSDSKAPTSSKAKAYAFPSAMFW
jgi:hypothetical protein